MYEHLTNYDQIFSIKTKSCIQILGFWYFCLDSNSQIFIGQTVITGERWVLVHSENFWLLRKCCSHEFFVVKDRIRIVVLIKAMVWFGYILCVWGTDRGRGRGGGTKYAFVADSCPSIHVYQLFLLIKQKRNKVRKEKKWNQINIKSKSMVKVKIWWVNGFQTIDHSPIFVCTHILRLLLIFCIVSFIL